MSSAYQGATSAAVKTFIVRQPGIQTYGGRLGGSPWADELPRFGEVTLRFDADSVSESESPNMARFLLLEICPTVEAVEAAAGWWTGGSWGGGGL